MECLEAGDSGNEGESGLPTCPICKPCSPLPKLTTHLGPNTFLPLPALQEVTTARYQQEGSVGVLTVQALARYLLRGTRRW